MFFKQKLIRSSKRSKIFWVVDTDLVEYALKEIDLGYTSPEIVAVFSNEFALLRRLQGQQGVIKLVADEWCTQTAIFRMVT